MKKRYQLSEMKSAKLRRMKMTLRSVLRAIRHSFARLRKGDKDTKAQIMDASTKLEDLKKAREEARKSLRLVNEVLQSKRKLQGSDKKRE